MPRPLTDRQKQALVVFLQYERRLTTPTLAELGRHFGIARKNALRQADALIKKGMLWRDPDKKLRSRFLTTEGRQAAIAAERELADKEISMVAIATEGNIIPALPKVDFQPVRDHLLILEIEARQTASGIALPDDADMGPPRGLVVAAGPGRASEYNPELTMPMDAKVGDVVYFGGTAFTTYLNGVKFGLIRTMEVKGIDTKASKVNAPAG